LHIDVFGQLRVSSGSAILAGRDFPGLKPKQVLQILVTERGHAVSKSRLADLLWGEALPQNHVATLETYISVLRRTLQPGGRASGSVVVTEPGGYRLDVSQVEVDLDVFDGLVAAAVGAEPAAALATLNRALGLVRGPALEDEPYSEWAEDLRTLYQQRLVQVLIDAGRLSLLTGEAAAALTLAERAVALAPLAEAGYQVLMTAYYSLWRQEEALAAFDRCRRLLADELGVDPLGQTVALHLAILRHEDVAALLPRLPETANVPPRKPGTALGSGSAAQAGSVDVPAGVPFVGRKAELAELESAVAAALGGRFTLVLVTGERGIGKTRLVDRVAGAAGVAVGANRCSDLEQGLPYLALSMALRPMFDSGSDEGLPVLDELLVRSEQDRPFDEFARMRAMEQLASGLAAAAPAILVLDDVQWADADTLTTLGYLRRRCPTLPIAVIMTCDRAGMQREAVRSLRPDLRIDLDVLEPAELSEFGDDDLYTATGGHPVFVAGYLEARRRDLTETFPADLREWVLTRCWDLGPQAYRLLSVASVLDQPVEPKLLASLVGTDLHGIAEELDRLVEERLLITVGQAFAFRHPGVVHILAQTLSPARRFIINLHAETLKDGQPRRRATDVQGPPLVSRPARRSTDGPSPRQPVSQPVARATDVAPPPAVLMSEFRSSAGR